MRPIFPIASLAGIILICLLWFAAHKAPKKLERHEILAAQDVSKEGVRISTPSPPPTPVTIYSERNSAVPPTNSIEERIDSLEILGARDDAESFQQIVAELKSPDAKVRKAALGAVIQFGSRDAIPILKEAAAQAKDAREKVALLDASEFLDLAPLKEIRPRSAAKQNSPTPNAVVK